MSRARKQAVKVTLVRARAIDPAVNKVAKTLADNGYDVTLLVWDRQHNLHAGSADGYSVHRFRFKAPYDRAAVFFYLPIWWLYELWFLLRHRCDVIHACDLDTLMPAVLAKLVKRVRLCYTIYDFYANNLPDGRCQPLRRLIRRLVAGVEKLGIGFTDALFLLDECRYDDVSGARINRLAYVQTSLPDCLEAQLDSKPRQKTDVAIFFAGTISRARGLEHMIQAIEGLDGVTLTIAGSGPDQDLLIDKTDHAGDNVQYIGWIPHDDVVARTIDADILFAFYGPWFPPSKWASSNKLFEAMMCGKPIIMTDDTSMADIVRKENCGLVVPYGDPAAIREAVLRLKNDPDLRQRLGHNGRQAYEQKYDWRIMEQRLMAIYRDL